MIEDYSINCITQTLYKETKTPINIGNELRETIAVNKDGTCVRDIEMRIARRKQDSKALHGKIFTE